MSFDERKLALLSIVPEQVRADILIRLHMFQEPAPGSTQLEQDESFMRLRNTLQKQLELTVQLQAMSSARGGGAVHTMGEEQSVDQAHDSSEDSWDNEPAHDDPAYPLFQMAKQAYAVYQNARGGKGGGACRGGSAGAASSEPS